MANEDYWEWLNLVESDGPFLSKSALKSFYPSGLPKADASVDDVNAVFVSEHSKWITEWTSLSGESYRVPRDRWVESVLRDLLEWGDYLKLTPGIEFAVTSPDGRVEINPFAVLEVESVVHAMVLVVDKTEDLRSTGTDGWAADAIDRMSVLLRASSATIGIVTDGRWWALVSAAPDTTTASGVFDATWWRGEEKPNRDSFFALANISSIALGAPEKRLELLFKESVASAEQITEALGDQVRRAVELVLQSMSDSHLRALSSNNPSPLPADARNVYEGAVTVLMRVVFLLFAEERGLFPEHELFRAAYSISGLRQKLSLVATETSEEALDHSAETWHRLLAVSQAVYGGASFEDIRMPAYGGSLFDPERFSWLYATDPQGRLLLRISDRVMLAVLDAVQIARVDGDARSLSFRDLDVEQIGYVYEGLLGYSAEYVDQLVIGLEGKSGYEPEITLAELENIREETSNADEFVKKLLDHLKVTQEFSKPKTANQLIKAMSAAEAEEEASAKTRLRHALLGDEELLDRLLPFAPLIREDLRAFPYVVPAGGLVMTESQQRSNTGTHYTPRSLAEEVVLHALEPLVYSPGPLDTEDSTKWVLKSSTEILNLKVADIAVGSGAFLVAAARYLAARLIEARTLEGLDIASEKDLERWAIREVVARCLYGADINGMAVEMCKLSLWLISMDPGKPFSFVDDKVFHGNTLLGVTAEEQLRQQHIDPTRSQIKPQRLLEFDIRSDLDQASSLRKEIGSGQVDDADSMRSTRTKKALLKQSTSLTNKLRIIADGIIATGLIEGGKPGKQLDAQFDLLADLLLESFGESQTVRSSGLEDLIRRGLTPKVKIGEPMWRPLHWILEVPDVLLENQGFDCIIGNPPFLGGKKIATVAGSNFESFIKYDLNGQKGAADLSAHFVRRAWTLLKVGGTLGLIATDRIGQGDTAEMSLGIISKNGTIYRAKSNFPWPGKAATGTAIVWAGKSTISHEISRILDGQRVEQISANLSNTSEADVNRALQLPHSFSAGMGVGLYGEGFILEEGDALLGLLSAEERNKLRPFVNGQTLMSGIPSRKWAIDVGDINNETELFEKYPNLARHLRETVLPVRELVTSQVHEERYWAFWDKRESLFAQVDALDRFVLATKDTRVPVFQFSEDAYPIYSDTVVVIATDSATTLGALSSSIHSAWFEKTRTGRGSASRYVVTRCLKTFPFPTDFESQLIESTDVFLNVRSSLQQETKSMTQLYNQLDDQDLNNESISALRDAQVELDHAVLRSYGWDDMKLIHAFEELAGSIRFTVKSAQREEIRRRLLSLNLESNFKISPPKQQTNIDEFNIPEGAMF